jgi:hypothetical protein
MFRAFTFILSSLSLIPTTPKVEQAVIPAVHFKYVTPRPDEADVFPRDMKIKAEIPVSDLAGLSGATARLFTARYVDDPDGPDKIAISETNSPHCKIFQARSVAFTPSLTEPFVWVGRLNDTDMRCGADHKLHDTSCYLVISKDTLHGSLIRLDPDDIDEYFEYAYTFVVTADPNTPCNTGTEAADAEDQRQRRHNRSKYVAARRVSKKEQRKIADVDAPKSCVKLVDN